MSIKSPTYDEPSHLASGFLSLTKQDYQYAAEHPPFIKSLAAFPLLFLDLRLPENYSKLMKEKWPVLGSRFLYQPQFNVDQAVFLCRIPMVLLAILLGFYVFLWAKKLYGDNAGILALILYVFSPNILAYSRLVITDFGVTCFMFIACFYFWEYRMEGSLRKLCLTSIYFGLALVSKFSALILFPIFCFVVFVQFFTAYISRRKDRSNSKSVMKSPATTGIYFVHLLVSLMVVLGVIFAAYGMSPDFISKYKQGFDSLQTLYFENTGPRLYYLMGAFYTETVWFYPIVVFLVKTPIPTLILIIWSSVIWRRTGANLINESYVLIPVVLIFISTFFDTDHTGVRRILPIYPFLFVFIARVVISIENLNFSVLKKTVTPSILAILVTWYLASSIKSYPDYLTYFNDLVGGAKNGIDYLDNASIDWGQDLKRLKPLMDQLGIEKIKLLYRGQADPYYYNISAEELTPRDQYFGPQPGYYAISVHYLIRLRTMPTAFGFSNVWKEKLLEPIGIVGHTIYIFNFGSS